MKRNILNRFATALLFSTVMLSCSAGAATPGVGDPAPDWTMLGSDGQQYTLSQLRGQYVVVAFFPKAFTTG